MAITPNLGLHQWDAEDAFLREEFNENFGKIDAGIAAAPERGHVAGFYTGSGRADTPVTVELGFSPSAVLIYNTSGDYQNHSVLLVRGTVVGPGASYPLACVTNTGFTVFLATDPGNHLNIRPVLNMGARYAYLAFR